MAGRHHTATISPDLIQQLFQVKYEDDERKKAAEEAEAEGDANGSIPGQIYSLCTWRLRSSDI